MCFKFRFGRIHPNSLRIAAREGNSFPVAEEI
jgi:hypothetical protein